MPKHKKLTRAKAIEFAIDHSDPGDEVTIHQATCTSVSLCMCDPWPIVVYIAGKPSGPVGFRRQDAE